MASSFTRSSRTPVRLSRSATRSNTILHGDNKYEHQQPNIGRKKRARESADFGEEPFAKKRQKSVIEPIIEEIKLRAKASKPRQRPLPTTNVYGTSGVARRSASPNQESATQTKPTQPSPQLPKTPINHNEKVVNGIKHELSRLQPNPADVNKDEGRKLRSQQDRRCKSKLLDFFTDYDEIIGNEPKKEYTLNLETPIIISDTGDQIPARQPSVHFSPESHGNDYPTQDFPDDYFFSLYDSQNVDCSFIEKNYKEEGGEDPVPVEYFEQLHQKPLKQEKSNRNSDREKAQHEKNTLKDILEGLRGHEWLKVLGPTGVTETKKKEYEQARDYYIAKCETTLAKFNKWNEEEKRRRLQKPVAPAKVEKHEEEIVEDEGNISDGDPPDYNDMDMDAARQLREEASARSATRTRHPERKSKVISTSTPDLEKDFVSFFAAPHLRERALGKHRRSGRSVEAWGHAIPEIQIKDFELSIEYRDEETLNARARSKRRERRVSKT